MRIGYFIGLFLFSMLFYSCIDRSITNIDSATYYNANWSLPIGTSSMSLEDLFSENSVVLPFCFNSIDTAIAEKWIKYDSCFIPDSGVTPIPLPTLIEEMVNLNSLLENIEYAKLTTFRLNITNGFQSEALLQGIIRCSNGMNIVLFNDGDLLVAPASVDATGKVTRPFSVQVDRVLTDEETESLQFAQSVVFEVYQKISQPKSGYLQLESKQEFSVQMGIRAELEIPLGGA